MKRQSNSVEIVLASKSPHRKAILNQIGIRFKSLESTYEEEKYIRNPTLLKVKNLVIKNAKGKALDVAVKTKGKVILGVDTVVYCNGRIIGKPKNSKDAKSMLSFLSGREHAVFSGIAFVRKSGNTIKTLTDFEITKVYFRNLSNKEIELYVSTGEPLDKAGGYGVQDKGAILIKRIDGDYYNVVGLPVVKLLELAKKMGIRIM